MEFLNPSDNEWFEMWAQLADYPMNRGDSQCPFMGAQWEYMGSTTDHHHFRHPKHPATGKAEYFYLERRRSIQGWG